MIWISSSSSWNSINAFKVNHHNHHHRRLIVIVISLDAVVNWVPRKKDTSFQVFSFIATPAFPPSLPFASITITITITIAIIITINIITIVSKGNVKAIAILLRCLKIPKAPRCHFELAASEGPPSDWSLGKGWILPNSSTQGAK